MYPIFGLNNANRQAVKIDVRGRHIVIPKTYFQYIPATPAPLRTSPSVPSPFSPTPPALPPPLPSPFAQSSVEPYARKSPFAIPPPDDEEGDLTSPRRRRKPAMAGDRKDPLAQYQQTGLEWIQQEEQKRQREQEEQRRQQELIDLEHRRKREAEDEKERLKHEELDIEKEELLEKLLHQQRLLQQHLPEANPAPNARNRESMSSIFAWSGQVNDDLAKILNWSPEEEERKKGQERKEREEREAREEKERKERKDKEKPSEDLDFEMMLSSLVRNSVRSFAFYNLHRLVRHHQSIRLSSWTINNKLNKTKQPIEAIWDQTSPNNLRTWKQNFLSPCILQLFQNRRTG